MKNEKLINTRSKNKMITLMEGGVSILCRARRIVAKKRMILLNEQKLHVRLYQRLNSTGQVIKLKSSSHRLLLATDERVNDTNRIHYEK